MIYSKFKKDLNKFEMYEKITNETECSKYREMINNGKDLPDNISYDFMRDAFFKDLTNEEDIKMQISFA